MSKFLIIILLVCSSVSFADQPGSVWESIPDPKVPEQVRLKDVVLKQLLENPFEYVVSNKFRFKEELTHKEFFESISRDVVFSFSTIQIEIDKLSLNDIEELHLAIIRGGFVHQGILYNVQNVKWIIQTDLDHVQFWTRFNQRTFKTKLLAPGQAGGLYAVMRKDPFNSDQLKAELEKKRQDLSQKMTQDLISRSMSYATKAAPEATSHRGVLRLKRPNPPEAPLCPQLF